MPDATVAARPDHGFTRADPTTFCRLDELGLEVTGQRLAADRAVLACRASNPTSGAAAAVARGPCVTR